MKRLCFNEFLVKNRCGRKARGARAQSFTLQRRATTRDEMAHLLLVCATYTRVHFFANIPFVVNRYTTRNANRVVATTSPPFCNEPHRSLVLCVKAELGTTFTSWSQHLFLYDRKARAASTQSFALWQQATIEITRRDHSFISCSRHIYHGCCSSSTSRSW